MQPMTNRERFIATAKFEKLDRPFRLETLGFWDETIARWKNEGLPPEAANPVFAFMHFGVDFQIPIIIGAHEHPGFDPLYDVEILMDNGRSVIKRDFSGSVMEVFKDGSSTPPRFIEFPVKDFKTWEEVKKRLDPSTPNRLGPQWDPMLGLADLTKSPLTLGAAGLFGTHRHLLGFEPLMEAYFDQPDLIHAISKHWLFMWKEVTAKAHKKHALDAVFLWEDMCGKNGPIISPPMFREFMSPYYKDLVWFVRNELEIPICGVDTDGELNLLIPLFVEAGVNMLWPFEVRAGMDVVKVRKEWPREFMIWGGIDKMALAGGKDAIDAEIDRVVPFMLEHGGYIPSIDHSVPPEVSLENFRYYLERIRKVGDEILRA